MDAAAYRKNNGHKIQSRMSDWRTENAGHISEYNKKYYADRRETEQDRSRKYYHENKPRYAESQRKRIAKNPLRYAGYAANRRAMVRGATGTHSDEQISALFNRQKGRCAACKSKLKKGFHRDHIKPLSKGGPNDIKNIQLLCPPCNISKKDKDAVAFMQKKGYLI